MNKMKPGRELDALVAELVFGLEVKISEGPYETSLLGLHPGDVYVGDGQQIKPYSTDIAAAWEVVEKLGLRGLLVTVRYGGKGKKGSTWLSSKHVTVSGDGMSIAEHGDTVPHAICLAALEAVIARKVK